MTRKVVRYRRAMRDFPPGWATDLAILEYSGSTIEDHGDHLIVRTPDNPDFHWGNCLFVTDEDTVHDADRWVKTFQAAFPEAPWIAIGLIRMPHQQHAWVSDWTWNWTTSSQTRTLPRQAPLPPGYRVRRLSGQDWALSLARSVAENDRTNEQDRSPSSGSPRSRCRRDVHFPSGTSGRPSAHSRASCSSPI